MISNYSEMYWSFVQSYSKSQERRYFEVPLSKEVLEYLGISGGDLVHLEKCADIVDDTRYMHLRVRPTTENTRNSYKIKKRRGNPEFAISLPSGWTTLHEDYIEIGGKKTENNFSFIMEEVPVALHLKEDVLQIYANPFDRFTETKPAIVSPLADEFASFAPFQFMAITDIEEKVVIDEELKFEVEINLSEEHIDRVSAVKVILRNTHSNTISEIYNYSPIEKGYCYFRDECQFENTGRFKISLYMNYVPDGHHTSKRTAGGIRNQFFDVIDGK